MNLSNRLTHEVRCTDEDIEQILIEMAEQDELDIVFDEETDNGNDDEDLQEALPEHEELLFEIVSSLEKNHGLSDVVWKITGIRCSAHCIQLAIKDTINGLSLPIKNIIDLCRNVVKHLRKSTTVHKLNANQIEYSLPRLDVETRWSSTYLMVN